MNISLRRNEPVVLAAQQALRDALGQVGGRVLSGHTGPINALAISPDGHWLATGSDDHTARLWDLKAKDPSATSIVLRGHENDIYSLAISPDGHWLATGSWDHTARLWDLDIRALLARAQTVAGRELTPDEIRRYVNLAP